jgi:hypothetical protein
MHVAYWQPDTIGCVKYMRENHKEKNHYFDAWHVAKGMIISLLL